MVAIPAVNWIVIGLEILVGIIWTSVFVIDIFPVFRLRKVQYQLSEHSKFVLRKSFGTYIWQIIKASYNLILILVVVILSYYLTEQEIPYNSEMIEPLTSVIPPIQILILIGLVIVFFPRRLLQLLIPAYIVRQLKYFALLGLLFLPLFVLEETTVQDLSLVSSLPDSAGIWINLLLPTQLLAENGITLTLVEKQQWFMIIFVAVPVMISLLYQLLPGLFGRIQKFGIYEWENGAWIELDTRVYESDEDTAVLLLHGMNSNKEMWSAFTNEIGSERIMDYLDRNTDERYLRTKIFALNFSDRMKQPFVANYKMKKQSELFPNTESVAMNNYVWELFYTLYLLKEVKEIERIHIIGHSSGGVIVRHLLNLIQQNENLQQLAGHIGYNKDTSSITTVDKISWMAVPHFGAQGGAAIFLSLRKTFPFNILLRGLFAIKEVGSFFDRLGGILLSIGFNAPATQNLDPYSSFIKKLNLKKGKVKLYGNYDYRNAYAVRDQVVGNGAKIKDAVDRADHKGKYMEEPFNADHSNAPWEQLSQIPNNKIQEYPPIHHCVDVIDWIFVKNLQDNS